MNVFKHELKSNLKSFLVWSLGLFFLVFFGLIEFSGFENDSAAVGSIFSNFPRMFLALMGINDLDPTTTSGYYGILFNYILIITSLFSINLGSNAAAAELNGKTSEFLFSKPLSRLGILSQKTLSGLLFIFVLCILNYIFSISSFAAAGIINDIAYLLFLFCAALFFVSIFFFAFGFFCSSLNVKKGSLIANLLFLCFYFLGFLYDMFEKNAVLRMLSPLKFFEVASDRKIEMLFVLYSIALAFVLLILSFWILGKKDMA